jgi:Ring finger domain
MTDIAHAHQDCCICLDAINQETAIKLTCHASHLFHRQCLVTYFANLDNLDQSCVCPLCRTQVDAELKLSIHDMVYAERMWLVVNSSMEKNTLDELPLTFRNYISDVRSDPDYRLSITPKFAQMLSCLDHLHIRLLSSMSSASADYTSYLKTHDVSYIELGVMCYMHGLDEGNEDAKEFGLIMILSLAFDWGGGAMHLVQRLLLDDEDDVELPNIREVLHAAATKRVNELGLKFQ